MRSPIVWLTACSAAFILAGCGGKGASLPRGFAKPAAEQAERIAQLVDTRRPCAASQHAVRLQGRTIDAVNAGTIPPELQEELLGRVNLVIAFIPCGAMDRGQLPKRDAAAEARKLADWIRDH